jgi:hypothetical protein
MSVFSVKCPNCGISLDAEEQYIGANVECSGCNFKFILQKPHDLVSVIKLQQSSIPVTDHLDAQGNLHSGETTFDFAHPPKTLVFAKPIRLHLPNGTLQVSSWTQVLFACSKYAVENNFAAVSSLRDVKTPFRKGVIFSAESTTLTSSQKLADNLFLEMNLSAGSIIKIICGLAKFCGFPLERFSVTYISQHTNVNTVEGGDATGTEEVRPDATEKKQQEVVSLQSSVDVFKFRTDVKNALAFQGIETVGDLRFLSWKKFSVARNIGQEKVKAMRVLIAALKSGFQETADAVINLETLPLARILSPYGHTDSLEAPESVGITTSDDETTVPESTKFFEKTVDWSLLTAGVTIPLAYHNFFLEHLSHQPSAGERQAVAVILRNQKYPARVIKIASSNGRKPVLQLLWGSKIQGIAPVLQTIFARAYARFLKDRKDKVGIFESLSFFRGKHLDEFVLAFNVPSESECLDEEFNSTDPIVPKRDITALKIAVSHNFPAGFLFNTATTKLLESALGRVCSEEEWGDLKREMFKRSDEVYLLPAMVAEEKVIGDMVTRIRGFWDAYGCFALSVLYKEFEEKLKNLTNPDSDFRLFLQKAVLPLLPEGGKVFGKLQRQLCIPGDAEEEETIECLAERVRGVLLENGDAILREDLVGNFGYLNETIIEMLLKESIPDAVEIKVDEQSYWKLVEFFYLPDDFKDFLQGTIRKMESNHTAPSLQALSGALELQYGADFRSGYAIDDDEVFKQIIAVNVTEGDYVWNRSVFVKQGSRQEINVADEFLQIQRGIFHESDFFSYAEEHRGFTNTGMLILTFLRNKCIRLDQAHWIALQEFDNSSNFSIEMENAIAQKLSLMLGHKAFLPLGTVSDAFLSSLPLLTINGNVFYWNHYMLASIAAKKVSHVKIINDEPSPYTVTAMAIPLEVKYQGDVIDYVFKSLKRDCHEFSSADEVFEYLKNNQIRMFKAKKLFARIRDFWGFE